MVDIVRDVQEICPNAVLLNYVNPMAMVCMAIGQARHASVRRPVPRRADHAGPDLPLRRRQEGRDRLPGGGDQSHGVVPEAGKRRQGPVPAVPGEPRQARVLRQREGARRGGASFRLLHDRIQRAPVGLPSLVPQERRGALRVLRPARARRGNGLFLCLPEGDGGEVRFDGLPPA